MCIRDSLYSLYWKRTTKAACWASFLFGSLLMVYNMLFRSTLPAIIQSPINCGVIAMLAGLIIVPVVSLITPAPEKELVEDAFSCYRK